MKARRQFDLDIYKLSSKKHYYEFDIDNSFFESFEHSLIEKGNLKVKLTLEKSETMLIADFTIAGFIKLICDRSLDEFDYPLDLTRQVIFKYGTEFAEISDEVVTIPKEIQKLDVSQFIYEFIGLEVPMKKLHPRYEGEEDSDEPATLIYSTKKEEQEGEEEENSDSVWEKLKKLKNNKN